MCIRDRVNVVIPILIIVGERILFRPDSFDPFDHRLRYGYQLERDSPLRGVGFQRVERAAQISLSNRRQVTVMPAVKRRHLDQQKTVAEADLRAIMAAPHKQVDKATLAQMVIVMGAAGLDRLLVLQCDFAKW